MQSDGHIKINPIIVGIVIFALIAVGILIYTLYSMLRPNPFGNEIRIDNFSKYYGGAPTETKDSTFAALYNVVAENLEGADIPSSGAVIRDGSASKDYDESNNVYYGNYIVDIESIGQSYAGHIEWLSGDSGNLSGYPIIFTCVKPEEMIYPDFGCVDVFSDSLSTIFPITADLPVKVDYFTDGYAERITYDINYEISDDDVITLIVSDYTGGNEARAREKIRELGYDPEAFEIIYENKVAEKEWPYVGDD